MSNTSTTKNYPHFNDPPDLYLEKNPASLSSAGSSKLIENTMSEIIPTKPIFDNTFSFTLEDNNTLIIGAKLFARVAAKTWIWKGIDFGLLGCLKMTSCGGDVVTYRANIL